jgi:phage gp36-like protein
MVVMPVFTIDTLRTTIGETAFMALADRDRDRVLGTEDTAAVERAILVGQADIDTRIRGKFKALVETTPEYEEAVLDCIIFRLQPRGRTITTDAKDRFDIAIRWAKDVKCDEAQLTSEAQPELRRSPAAKQTGPERQFTTIKLRDLL